MSLSVRPATPADIPELHALIEGAYRGDSARRGWTHEADLLGGQRTDVEALEEILADEAKVLLTAWDGPTLVGCVLAAEEAGGVGYLGMLSVDPARQAGGIGRRLVEAAEAWCGARGCGVMRMTVIRQREALIAWYERLGYVRVGTEPFPATNPRFGLPKRDDLGFVVLRRPLQPI